MAAARAPLGVLTPETVVFAHAVNTRAKLEAALADPRVNFLEADVVLSRASSSSSASPADGGRASTGAGAVTSPSRASSSSSSPSPVAVMGHDPGAPPSSFDLTLADFLRAAADAHVGVKLDVKEHGAWPLAVAALAAYEGRDGVGAGPAVAPWPLFRVQRGPATSEVPAVIVNADVLTGTTSAVQPGCRFNSQGAVLPGRAAQVEEARIALQAAARALPVALLSPGWTTAGEGRGYTAEMVEDMLEVLKGRERPEERKAAAAARRAAEGAAGEEGGEGEEEGEEEEEEEEEGGTLLEAGIAVTFPVRATYVRSSYRQLLRLLDALPSASLTVWSNVHLAPEEEAWLRANLDPRRTLYDLPPPGTQDARASWRFRAAEAFGAVAHAAGGVGREDVARAAAVGAGAAVVIGVGLWAWGRRRA
jgi:hypothetical protein